MTRHSTGENSVMAVKLDVRARDCQTFDQSRPIRRDFMIFSSYL